MLNGKAQSRSHPVSADRSSPVTEIERAGARSRDLAPRQSKIGFIGLGRMGSVMAANLSAAGRQVVAYVRRAEQMEQLAEGGLSPTVNIADVYDSEFIVTMLPDDRAVLELTLGRADLGVEGFASHLAPGAIHISMSTISTAASSKLADEHARHRQGYVAAPVFGNPDAAKERQLFVIAAGAPDDVSRCQSIFDAIGQRTFLASSTPADANLVKLAGNAMTAATLELLGEVLALARKRGLDPRQLLAILTETMFGSRVHKIYGAKIADQNYTSGGFVFPLALKDVRLALREADTAEVPMPCLSVVRDRFITGIARGYSKLDWSAIGLLAEEDAGLAASRRESDVA
jgi:3-hydroxyisobutyrate dehydrogenase-like beta-hydroxyacid dehydrogenase